jgi:hypothetical protein
MEIVTGGESIELSIGVAPLHDDIKDLIDASQSVADLRGRRSEWQQGAHITECRAAHIAT